MTTTTTKSAEAPEMPIADRLEHCAKFTGLDAVRELLLEAAAAVRKRDAVVKLLEGELQDRARATQAEVTEEQIKEAATKAVKERNLSWVWFEKDDQDKYTIPILSESHYQFARAILALRPERVSMTDEQISLEAHNADDRDWNDLRFRSSWHEGFLEGARFAEAHHGVKPKEQE